MNDYVQDPMLPQRYIVKKKWRETYDTVTMALEPAGGDSPFPFLPGQFNMLYAFGQGEVPISISGDTKRPDLLVHTIRSVGKTTKSLCGLKRGEMLGVRGPFGTGWPVEDAKGSDVVVVAGGLGLAPLRPVIYHLLAHRSDYGNVVLLYGARTPQDLLFTKEIEKWSERSDIQVEVTVDAAKDDWHGHVGVVPVLLERARFNPALTTAMVCGPEIMMRFTIIDLLHNRNVQMERIHLSMERNMKCGLGFCGHCQLGPFFICKDGPVFRCDSLREWAGKREL
jgi:NAD(P)H-flavin reductase